jgi:hypothetical protein
MPDNTTNITGNSYSGGGQVQWGTDGAAFDAIMGGKAAGGMRGLGLITFILGQILLQNNALDLASDYYNTNRQDFQFFQNTHEGPMRQSVTEAFSQTTNPTYPWDMLFPIPAAAARIANTDKQWLISRKSLSKYAVGAGQRVDYEFGRNRIQQYAASWYLGWRGELAYQLDHNERQFNRQAMVVNIGIGVGNEVSKGLASAAGNLESAYGQLGNQFGSLASGLSGQIGQRQGYQDATSVYKQLSGY